MRGSAAFDLETMLSNEAIKALDDELDGIAKGQAPTAAKRKRAKMVGPAADLSAESSSSSSSSGLAGWLPGFLGGSYIQQRRRLRLGLKREGPDVIWALFECPCMFYCRSFPLAFPFPLPSFSLSFFSSFLFLSTFPHRQVLSRP